MEFRVENRTGVPATSDALWAVLTDFEGWRHWNPVFTEAAGAIGFGAPINLTERIAGLGERQVSAVVGDWVPYSRLVWSEKRGWAFRSTRYVTIEEIERGSCIVSVGEIFGGLRGENHFMRHRRILRDACETMNVALRERALLWAADHTE